MATGEVIITGELMATGEAELHNFQTLRDGRTVASWDRHFSCWPSSYLEFSLVLIFVASKLDHK